MLRRPPYSPTPLVASTRPFSAPARRRARACLGALACGLALISCQSVRPQDNPDFGLKNLANGDSTLAMAALVAEFIDDRYARTFIYTRLADEYQRRGQVQEALVVIARGERHARQGKAGAQQHQLLIELAGYFINYSQYQKAHDLLSQALKQTLAIKSQPERGQALESIILTCFRAREYLADILRTAIDGVYALYDPELRVMLLTDLGRKFQEADSSNRASALIQQSLASASSISNPWARGLAHARIGERYYREGDPERGRRQLEQAARETEGVDILNLSSGDTQNLINTLVILANNGRFNEANSILNRLPPSGQRDSAMLVLVERYLTLNSVLPARLLVQRLLNQLAQDDPESQGEASLAALVRLAELYAQAGIKADAARYIQAAMVYLDSPRIANTSPYRARLALAMARIGRLEEAIANVGLMSDDFVASQTLRQLAVEWKQPSLLAEATRLARSAPYLKETAMAELAVSWWRNGQADTALGLLADIGDPYTLANALVEAVALGPGAVAAPLDANAETRLRAIAKSWYDRPLKAAAEP